MIYLNATFAHPSHAIEHFNFYLLKKCQIINQKVVLIHIKNNWAQIGGGKKSSSKYSGFIYLDNEKA